MKRNVLVGFILLNLVILLILGCSGSKELVSGKIYLQQGELEKAEEELISASKIEPQNSEIPFLLGSEIYAEKKEWLKMDEMFERSLKIDSKWSNQINNFRLKYSKEIFISKKLKKYDDSFNILVPISLDFKKNNYIYNNQQINSIISKLDSLCKIGIALLNSESLIDIKSKYEQTIPLDSLFKKYSIDGKNYILTSILSEIRFLLISKIQKSMDRDIQGLGFVGAMLTKMKTKPINDEQEELCVYKSYPNYLLNIRQMKWSPDKLSASSKTYTRVQKNINHLKTKLFYNTLEVLDKTDNPEERKRCWFTIKRMLSGVDINKLDDEFINIEDLPNMIGIKKGELLKILNTAQIKENNSEISEYVKQIISLIES